MWWFFGLGWVIAIIFTAVATVAVLGALGFKEKHRVLLSMYESKEQALASSEKLLQDASSMIGQYSQNDALTMPQVQEYIKSHPNEHCLVLLRVPKRLVPEETQGAEEPTEEEWSDLVSGEPS